MSFPPNLIQAPSNRVFPGRGGGLAILVNSVTKVTVDVINCSFFGNEATEFGGGAYVLLPTTSSHLITFQSCDFEENWSETHAGGLGIGISGNGNGTESNSVTVRDCLFHDNSAPYGGGVYVFFLTGDDVISLPDYVITDLPLNPIIIHNF